MADTQSQPLSEFSESLLLEKYYDDPEKLSQLLRHRAGRDTHFQFTSTSDSGSHSISAPAPGEDPQLDAHLLQLPATSPARDPLHRRASTHSRHVIPSLPTHHSAPTDAGIIMDRAPVAKMYATFTDGDVMGDTQPDSQIYKNYTSGIHQSHSHGPNNARSLLSRVEHTQETPSGGTEVGGSSPEQHRATITSPTLINDDDDDDDEADTQQRSNAPLTSPLKFETPAMAGRKRDNQGEVLSSGMRTETPGTAMTAVWGMAATTGMGNSMSLTQIFNATQVATSPIVGAPNEDAVFERPSPNFAHPRQSSPVPVASSPIQPPRSDFHMRSSSEPRAEYVTMKQSQERKSREVEHRVPAFVAQDSWDDSLEAYEKERAARKARGLRELEAAKTFRKVTAPSLSSPHPKLKKRGGKLLSLSASLSATPKSKTPASRRGARRSAYDGPFDDDESENELSLPTPMSKSMGDRPESPDALSQGVPSSTRPTPLKFGNHMDNKVQVPRTSSHPQGTLSGRTPQQSPPGSPEEQLLQESQSRSSQSQSQSQRLRSLLRSNKDTVTIADSQPIDSDSIPRPKSLLMPSSPSTNEYSINQTTLAGRTGFTSQMISSSVPPPPPISSPPIPGDEGDDEEQVEDNEERVPSSPPALDDEPVVNETLDDEEEGDEDIVYDEHDYEEHHCGEEDEAEEHGKEGSEDGENDMDVDDAVPESEPGEDEDEDRNEEEEMKTGAPPRSDVEMGDDELPETMEQEELIESPAKKDEMVHSSHPEDVQDSPIREGPSSRRLERQDTVPESDMMDDTQPSIFAQTNDDDGEVHPAASGPNDRAAYKPTTVTQALHTAQEHHSPQHNNTNLDAPAVNTKVSPVVRRFRSLNDIANEPETQVSADMEDIEIPQLSFHADVDDDFNAMMSGSSPARPAAKKRRVMYSTKKRGRMSSPVRFDDQETEQPPSSPLKQVLKAPEQTAPGKELSVLERLEQSALAKADAHRETDITRTPTLKSRAAVRPKPQKKEKRGALKPVNKALQISPRKVKTATETGDAVPEPEPAREETPIPVKEKKSRQSKAVPEPEPTIEEMPIAAKDKKSRQGKTAPEPEAVMEQQTATVKEKKSRQSKAVPEPELGVEEMPITAKDKKSKQGKAAPEPEPVLEEQPTTAKEKKLKQTKRKRSRNATPISGPVPEVPADRTADVEMPDAETPMGVTDELAGSPANPTEQTVEQYVEEPAEQSTTTARTPDRGEAPTEEILVPNRVIAFWPGSHYYPATCLGYTETHRLQIRYDDGNITTLEPASVRMLDLRIGDHVKIEQPGLKSSIFVIIGFKDKIPADHEEEFPLTDQHGYKTVVLEQKHRASLPAAKMQEQEPIEVPLADLYLTSALWSKYQDRPFVFAPSETPSASTSRVATPVGSAFRPNVSMSGTGRRSTMGPSMLRESLRAASVASTTLGSGTVFNNMAFAITLSDENMKEGIVKLITSNGGQIVAEGFHELFEPIDPTDVTDAASASASAAPSPASKATKKGKGKATTPEMTSSASETEGQGLVLKEDYKSLAFAALITDMYSRRTKHIQALALNIPCLHHRWLSDSISASRPLAWGKYLLPAGISTYLDPKGVVRSRNMEIWDPASEDASFAHVVQRRELLLRDQSVLLVMGKSKKEFEKKKPYLFLTHALGPRRVGRCSDIGAAREVLQSGDWDWVYVDGGVEGVWRASDTLFSAEDAGTRGTPAESSKGVGMKGKKRKRGVVEESGRLVREGFVGGKMVRVACDEFVVQSLILGGLVEV